MFHHQSKNPKPFQKDQIKLNDPLRTALNVLFRAYCYMQDFQTDVWQFAVEISELRRLNLTNNEFRWLLACELVDLAEEITQRGDELRRFQPTGKHCFSDRTCFVLTPAGAEFAAGFSGEKGQPSPTVENNGSADFDDSLPSTRLPADCPQNGQFVETTTELQPRWDAERKELRIGKHLVKVLKWPSPNQETILAVFEEEGWPARIDDPLSPVPEQDPKRRLHDTIKCLNRNHKIHLIRFRGDGTGEGVVWTHVTEQNGMKGDT